MRVITLDPHTFGVACKKLAALIINRGSNDYSLAIPIITGGAKVADELLPYLPPVRRYDVLLQRPATARKNSHPRLFKLLRHCPQFLTDILRMAESEFLNRFSARKVKSLPVLSGELVCALEKLKPGDKILVIDDSVDTGSTAAAVKTALLNVNPLADIKLATLTITMRNPMVIPDFTLYEPRTLIRFPWSKDYAGK